MASAVWYQPSTGLFTSDSMPAVFKALTLFRVFGSVISIKYFTLVSPRTSISWCNVSLINQVKFCSDCCQLPFTVPGNGSRQPELIISPMFSQPAFSAMSMSRSFIRCTQAQKALKSGVFQVQLCFALS